MSNRKGRGVRKNSVRAWLFIGVVLAGCTKKTEKVVNLYIWSNYTAPDELAAFTRDTGIKVNVSNYASNEELLAKLQAGATGFDIAVPSDYMVGIMTKLDMLRPLDKSRLAHAQALDPQWLGKAYDPSNSYSLPYAWTLTGIAVNAAAYGRPVQGWGDLLATNEPKAKGHLSLLDDVRETIGAALKYQGASLNSTKSDELAKAKALLQSVKKDVKAFSSTPIDLVASGEVLLAHMYSNDAQQAAHTSGKQIQFLLPKEGGTLAIDNAVILASAPHVDEAYALLNYLYQPQVDAALVARTFAGPVLRGVREQLPAELRQSPILFPDPAALSRCEMMQDLGAATATYDRLWTEVKAASH